MVIVCAADDKFALPLGVTLYSAISNLDGVEAALVYIIDGGISEENKSRLAKVLRFEHLSVSISWIRPESHALNGVKTGEYSQAAYLRLFIPELLPPRFERAIYLDSDLIVERNLRLLWEEPMGSKLALAVQDYMIPEVSSGPQNVGLSEMYDTLGLQPGAPYYNSGVIVVDLKRWRDENIGQRVMAFCCDFQRYDQDGLNAIIGKGWGLLDPRWNVLLSDLSGTPLDQQARRHVGEQVFARFVQQGGKTLPASSCQPFDEPFILHYTTFPKPWHFVYRGPARSRWFHYLRESGWFGEPGDIDDLMRRVWTIQNEYEPGLKRLYPVSENLQATIPQGHSFILVDQDDFWYDLAPGRHSIPFLEHNGQYWGCPADDATAIREFERIRTSGASFIVFGWPAFWWLDHYRDFERHLRQSYRCVLRNDDLVVFDLRKGTE